jgi:hypothetical protein
MLYKAKNIAALQIALGSLPGKMPVEIEPGIGIAAKTVADLRHLESWPDNLAVSVPQAALSDSAVRVSSAQHAGRTSPKP